ncbi:MAG: D-aminoacyl-tRNA deacylase, partial [candidate division Zixibacteria bacterium]|nr:D-aminoacyl-tRNA deacylase [candidate division Zixibacteria bacterium]
MRICLQRVQSARVLVDDQAVGQIGPGLVLLVGFKQGDTD